MTLNERLSELQEDGALLSGLSVVVPFDSGELIRKDLVRLGTSGIFTIAFVMMVLFLAIGWREALIAGSAIPLSFLVAFIALLLSGNTINFISLFALILGVGILVDSAVVMVCCARRSRSPSSAANSSNCRSLARWSAF